MGEVHLDDNQNNQKIDKIELVPAAKINPFAAKVIKEADWIIIGPGDYYASLISALAPLGIKAAFSQSKAKILYILNLMTRLTQTRDMTASDHVKGIEKVVGKEVDHILLNTQPISDIILDRYAQSGEHPVVNDLKADHRLIKAPILSDQVFTKSYQDNTHRELLRHDSDKLLKVMKNLLK